MSVREAADAIFELKFSGSEIVANNAKEIPFSDPETRAQLSRGRYVD